MLNTLAEKIDPRWAAVVVVDMQNDFISPGGAWDRTGQDISMAQEALTAIVTLIARARDLKVPIAFIRSIYNGEDNRHLSDVYLHQARKHPSGRFIEVPVCVEGSWGWQLAAGLEPDRDDMVIAKHRYSAFHGTDLDARLRKRGIRTLLLTGVGTGVCVEATARQGFELDYYNVILTDCCGAYTRNDHEQALQRLNARFGEVARSGNVFSAWNNLKLTAD